jgi:hypothetical protein
MVGTVLDSDSPSICVYTVFMHCCYLLRETLKLAFYLVDLMLGGVTLNGTPDNNKSPPIAKNNKTFSKHCHN